MPAMKAYILNRLSERSTWVGIVLFLAVIGVLVCYRQDILVLIGAPLSGLIAALPDRLLKLPWRSVARLAAGAISRALTRSAAPPPAVAPIPIAAEPPRRIPMSLVDDFKAAFETAAENAGKAALKAAIASMPGPAQVAANAIISAAETPTVANITVAVADALAVFEAALATVPAGYVAAPAP